MPVPQSSSPGRGSTSWVKEQEASEEWLLDCECSTPKVLLSLLSSLSDSQHTTFYCSPTAGLTIHTHPNPQFQCTLELPVGLFSKFHVPQDCDFCVSYKALLDCLGILTIEHPLQLSLKYHGPSEVLKLEATLRQGVSSAALSGMVPPEASAELSAAFGASPVIARLLCSSKDLQDWAELDTVAGVASIQVCWQPQSITVSVVGHSSQCQVVLALPVDAQQPKVQYSYPFQAWKRAMKPLEVAKETCLSINANGILAIQHQMVHEDTAAFCDSLVLPLVEENVPNHENENENDEQQESEAAAEASATTTTQSSPQSHNNHHYHRPFSSSQGSAMTTTTTTTRPFQRAASSSIPRATRHDDDASTIPSVVTQQQRHSQQPPLHNHRNHDATNHSNQEDSETDDGNDEPSQPQPRPLLFGAARRGSFPTGAAAVAATTTTFSSNTSSLSLTPATTASPYPPASTTTSLHNHRRSRKRAIIMRSNMDDDEEEDDQMQHDDDEEEQEETNNTTGTTSFTNSDARNASRRRRRQQQRQRRSSSTSSDSSNPSSSPLAPSSSRRSSRQPRHDPPASPSPDSPAQSEILYCSSPEVVYGGD